MILLQSMSLARCKEAQSESATRRICTKGKQSVWLPCTHGFNSLPSDAPTAVNVSVHQHTREELVFFSNYWYLSELDSLHLENEAPSCEPGVSVPWEASKNASTTHLQQLPGKKRGAQMWIHTHTCANTQQKGVGPWGRGMAGLHVMADGPAPAA